MVAVFFHRIGLLIALLGIWCILSGIGKPIFFLYGLMSSLIAMFVSLRMHVIDPESQPHHLAFSAPLYWLWLLKEMVISGIGVTRLVWSTAPVLTPAFAWMPINLKSDLGRTIFANSITLTPGTVCLDVKEKRVLVHALEKSSIEALQSGEMSARVGSFILGRHRHLRVSA